MPTVPSLARRCSAEVVGTFVFVFIGADSAIATKSLGVTDPASALLIAAFANGLGLAVGIAATLATSGGSLNPAVTVGLWVGKKLHARDVIPYIVAEVVGATIAVSLLRAVTPSSIGNAVDWGSPTLSSAISAGQGILFELVMTFFLVFVVYGTIVDKRAPRISGLAVGLLVLGAVLVGGVYTGPP